MTDQPTNPNPAFPPAPPGMPPPSPPPPTWGAPLPPPPPVGPSEPASAPWWKRSVPLWALIVTALVAIGLGAASATEPEGDTVDTDASADDLAALEAQVDQLEGDLADRDATVERLEDDLDEASAPTTTRPAPTTTAAPTTTVPPTTTAPPGPVEVARFSGGSTGTETADFTVDGTWELQYTTSGGAGLIVTIVDSATHASIDNIAPDPGSGSSTFRQGGTFYLQVDTFGTDAWEIAIIDLP